MRMFATLWSIWLSSSRQCFKTMSGQKENLSLKSVVCMWKCGTTQRILRDGRQEEKWSKETPCMGLYSVYQFWKSQAIISVPLRTGTLMDSRAVQDALTNPPVINKSWVFIRLPSSAACSKRQGTQKEMNMMDHIHHANRPRETNTVSMRLTAASDRTNKMWVTWTLCILQQTTDSPLHANAHTPYGTKTIQ